MKKILHLILLLLSIDGFATTYYVSNTSAGNSNSNSGLSASLAWTDLKKVNSFDFKSGDIILFKRGDVFYGKIIVSRNNLVFDAYGSGVRPVISGFTTLANWTKDNGGIWHKNIPAADNSLIVVTINNQLQRLGRYPNYNAANGGYLNYESFNKNIPSITDEQLTGATNWIGAEIAIRKEHWVIDICKVIAQNGHALSYSNPTGNANTYYGKAGYGYFFQNDIRTLDQFGEWFLNKSTKDLSIFFGAANPSSYTIKASTIDTLFNCGGGASGYISKKNITLKNIAFEGANQTAFFAWDGANITVQNCTFNNNRNGIYMWNIASSQTDGNSVTNILNTAIEQRGKVSKPTVITNNVIKNVSLFAGMGTSGDDNGTAITQDGNNSTIHYNRIDSIGYNGITWQGNNVSIKYNYVTNFLLVKDDGGGIYTWNGGNTKRYDRVIDHNIVVGAIGESYGAPGNNQSARCIYLDDNTNFTTVTNNTLYIASGAAIYCSNIVSTRISNNTIYNIPLGISIQRFPNTSLCRNDTITSNIIYPTVSNIFYWNGSLNYPTTSDIQTDMRAIGFFDSNYYRSNPSAPFDYFYHLTSGGTFVNPAALSFSSWQTFINQDSHSKIISTAVTTFKYNPSSGAVVYNFPGLNKKDVYGNSYNDKYTIPPWSSVILFDNGPAIYNHRK